MVVGSNLTGANLLHIWAKMILFRWLSDSESQQMISTEVEIVVHLSFIYLEINETTELAQSCGNFATDLSARFTGEHLVGLRSCVYSLNNIKKNIYILF